LAGVLAISLSSLLSACAPGTFQLSLPDASAVSADGSTKLELQQKPFAVLPGWEASDLVGAMPTFLQSCDKIASRPADAPFGTDPLFGTVAEWSVLCEDARAAAGRSERALRYFFETRFQPYLVTDRGKSDGMFTGYFEAELRGSWQRDSRYSVPIYARPNDLISVDLGKFRAEWAGQSIAGRIVEDRFYPYPSRAEINNGALAGRQLEILWVDSYVDAFFLGSSSENRRATAPRSALNAAW